MPKEDVFAQTVQKSNQLLNDLEGELEWIGSRNKAYSVLRSVIQTLRDRLTVEEVADFGAQLPMLIRGMFYEGWKPSKIPIKFNRAEFIGEVERKVVTDPSASTEKMIQSTLKCLRKNITKGEMEKIKKILPRDFAILFPE